MGTNGATLVADLFLFCCERDTIDAFNTTSRYLNAILNIDDMHFDNIVSQLYPLNLQLNKSNTTDTETSFLDLHLPVSNDIVPTKIYDKRDDLDFEIVNFPFLDGDVPLSYPMEFIFLNSSDFARASSHVVDINTRIKLKQRNFLKLHSL